MARTTGREATRLWFEFLKRAHHAKGVRVNARHYKAWGDVVTPKFEAWWKQHSDQLFPLSKVELAQRRLSDAGQVQLAVPMALTPTDAANQVRQLLMEHYKAIGHKPMAQRVYALTEGAEIKVSQVRAYLVTYDAHQQLLQSMGVQRVPAKLVLAEVRRWYLARTDRWKNTKRKVEGLPMALAGDAYYDAATDSVVVRSGDDISAERAIRRYLAIAENLVRAAARGDFPGKDYFKI